MADYEFELPFPPSINGYWRTFRNRQIISKKGRDYRSHAAMHMSFISLSCEEIRDHVSVSIVLNPPTLRRYDIDNFCKAIFDSLTHSGFWLDDSQVQKLTIEKGEKVAGGCVKISVNLIKT